MLLRGARQVGKSSTIRELGKSFKCFVEVNFERDKDIAAVFSENLEPQEITARLSSYYQYRLYYWQHLSRSAQAELDYVSVKDMRVVPLEVKAGTSGSMKSMYQFMEYKNLSYGIRSSLENFGRVKNVEIFPLYAISNLFQ